jgi:large subunit ribosomal protein L5
MSKTRLEQEYFEKIRPALLKELSLKNVMQVPQVSKIVLNIGVKDAVADERALQDALQVLERISGQKPVRCLAKKSIAAFKLREGMPIGAKVTLRGSRMYNFLLKLITLALPKVRDFRGISADKFDNNGGYNLGIKDWNIFPEVPFSLGAKIAGMNITIDIRADNNEHAKELLKKFKMPFNN